MAIELTVGEIYVTATGKKDTIVRAFTPDDPDYQQGFRFRGQSGYSYNTDGTVDGGIGAANIVQMGAEPLVQLASYVPPPLALQIDTYYRNGLGALVLLTRTVDPDTNRFRSGYRYIDHNGTYYTETGSVNNRLFKSLNLVSSVETREVSPAELEVMVRQEATARVVAKTTSTAQDIANGALGVLAGASLVKLGIGAVRLVARA